MSEFDHAFSGIDPTQAARPLERSSGQERSPIRARLRLLSLIALSIFFGEVAAMFIFPSLAPLPTWPIVVMDALLLVALMAPVLYFGLFRGLIRHIEAYRRIEAALKRELAVNTKFSSELERRVAERTESLERTNENLRTEIRERRLAQKRLHQVKSDLQAVFDAISDPLVLMEKDMTVKMLNRSAARYYGLSHHRELVGVRCHEMLMKNLLPCPGCRVPEGITDGGAVMFEREGFMVPNRREEVYLYPVAPKDSRAGDILMRISDITEKRMLERQLVHNEKMASLGLLVSSVAHEINNPNSFIGFNIPILRDYLEEILPIVDAHVETHPDLEIGNMAYADFRADIADLLDNVEHGSRRISAFVSNLREFSRFNSDVSEAWVDLRQVVDKATAICRARLKSDVESFTVHVPEGLPRIWSDAAALEQILLNLLINAAQAVEKQGARVRLSAAVQDQWGDHVVIEVTDNGCGMDAETRQKVFEPFFSTKSREEGAGLGLYVCQNLVERLRGRIEIESAPGKGSTFRVILPDKERRRQHRL